MPLWALRSQRANVRFNWTPEVGEIRLNPIVAICLDWACRNINSVPVKVYRKLRSGEEIELKSHPVLELLKTPNPVYSGSDLLSATMTDLLLIGNAYVLKARTYGGTAGELYWLDARYVAPDFPMDGSQYLHSWAYTPAGRGKTTHYEPTNVIDFRRGIDPLNDRLGISPMRAAERSVAIVNLLENYTGAVLKNSGSTNIVVAPTGEGIIQDKDAEKLRMSIQQRISGDLAGSPLVFNSPTDVKTLGSQPKDLLLEGMDMAAVARICAAFGQAPMIHGLPDAGKTYSNYHEAVKSSWENGIQPYHDMIADTLNHKLLNEFDDSGRLRLAFDYSNVEVLAEDQQVQATRATLLFEKNVITQNEAREMVGKEPTPTGDVFNYELQAALMQSNEPDADNETETEPENDFEADSSETEADAEE